MSVVVWLCFVGGRIKTSFTLLQKDLFAALTNQVFKKMYQFHVILE